MVDRSCGLRRLTIPSSPRCLKRPRRWRRSLMQPLPVDVVRSRMPTAARYTSTAAAITRPADRACTPLLDLQQFRSPAFKRMLAELEQYARLTEFPVLLEGESGTGKTGVAHYVHRVSRRAAGPFETVLI